MTNKNEKYAKTKDNKCGNNQIIFEDNESARTDRTGKISKKSTKKPEIKVGNLNTEASQKSNHGCADKTCAGCGGSGFATMISYLKFWEKKQPAVTKVNKEETK